MRIHRRGVRLLPLDLMRGFAPLPSVFELAFTLREDPVAASVELVFWCDVSDGAVESLGVVVLDVGTDESTCIFERERSTWSDAFALE